MSVYSSIDRRINADSWFRDLSHDAQLVFFRLLTGMHVTPVPGLWATTEDGLARSFGYDLERFRELLRELSAKPSRNGLPKVLFDWSAGVIWLPNSLSQECNQPKNENTLLGWQTHLELVPECDLKDRALKAFKAWVESMPNRFPNGWPNRLPNPSANGCGNGMANQEQEQKQDQDQEQQRNTRAAAAPKNLTSALALDVQPRSQSILDDTHSASWLEPQRWPEVVEVAEALHVASGLKAKPRLGQYSQDAGVRALVALFAAGFSTTELVAVATSLPKSSFWKQAKSKMGLGSLTLEVVRRQQAELEKPSRASPGRGRQPNSPGANLLEPEYV